MADIQSIYDGVRRHHEPDDGCCRACAAGGKRLGA